MINLEVQHNQMFSALLHLFFPNICYGCNTPIAANVQYICPKCLLELPQTKFWCGIENEAEMKFWGKVNLEKAMSFLYFHSNGKVQNIIHHFKYGGVKDIGVVLGEWCAQELQPFGFFDDIDLIIPIPIHDKKKAIRGFNQSDCIADGIGNITNIRIAKHLLVKSHNTKSQTRKSRFNRWKNAEQSFVLREHHQLSNMHVLLIDDVLTTGSTVEAATLAFAEIKNLKISLLTVAMTY